MKKLYYLLTIAAGMFAAGCSEDFNQSDDTALPAGPTVRLAVYEPATRAMLDGHSVVWETGDRISINGTACDLQGNASDGWYVEVAEAESYEAIYPAELANGSNQVILPETQHYTAGTFDPAAHPMYAEASATGEGLTFRNMCGLLHLQLTGNQTLQEIELTGNNGEYLAGTGTVAADGFELTADGSHATRSVLTFDEGVTLTSVPLSCYLVVPAQEFANGFTIKVRTADGQTMTRSTQEAQTITRSGMLTMPALAFEADVPAELPDFTDPQGVFVLNEGNMTTTAGSLIYIDKDGNILDNVYKMVNGSELGNTTQDLCIRGDKMYIISQNGGYDGQLIITDSRTLKKIKAYSKEELSTLSWPTHVAVLDESNIFIRDNAGIYRLDNATGSLTLIEGSNSATKTTMVTIGDKVFAAAGNNVYVLEANRADVAHSIAMSGKVTGLAKSGDGNLYVSISSPAQISKINTTTYDIIKTNDVTEGSLSAGWGATSGITAVGDLIYYSGAQTTIYCHNFATGESKLMIDAADVVENSDVVYNNIAAHPLTGKVYMTTIKDYGQDYLINNISLFRPENGTLVLDTNYTNHTAFPAGVFFPANFE